uniref:Uncharacterized protein n=1 Tax=Heteroscytonema crispum UCFS10 TaxID=1885250 RepID=A0A3G2KSI4_9CYAN|nr:hypothetical protein [Heteroscytonema crispum UCFS10]
MNFLPCSINTPLSEVVIYSFPLGEIVWEHSPCTTRTQNVKDCVHFLCISTHDIDHLVLTQESVLIRLAIVLMSGYLGKMDSLLSSRCLLKCFFY